MQKSIKTTKTPFNARNHYINFFKMYDFYFAHVLDPLFVSVHVGTRFSIQCLLFDIQIECNRSFKDANSAHLYYEKFYTKILERFIKVKKENIQKSIELNKKDTCKVNIQNNKVIDESNNKYNKTKQNKDTKQNIEEVAINTCKRQKIDIVNNKTQKNVTYGLYDYNSNGKQNNKDKTADDYNKTTTQNIINNSTQNECNATENEENIKNNFKIIFDALNMKNLSFEISYIKLQNKYKSVFCVNDQAYFGVLCNNKKEAAESALSTYFEALHVEKSKKDTINKQSEIKNTEQSKTEPEFTVFDLYSPIVKKEITDSCIESNDISEYVKQKYNENNTVKKINEKNKKEENEKTIQFYDDVDIDKFDFYIFINEYCIKNRINFPEYCIEKQNDVYICKAEFNKQNFTSKYFFDKNDAKKDVCRLIYNFIAKNKQHACKIENNDNMHKEYTNERSNKKQKHSDAISIHSKKLIENMTDVDNSDYFYATITKK